MTNTRSIEADGPPESPESPESPVAWTPTLFDAEPVRPDPVFGGIRRIELSEGAWVDIATGWLHGAAAVFDDLVANVGWRHGRRLMYGRFVDEPRLHGWGRDAVTGCSVALPVIDHMASLLSRRYGVLLSSVGLNYYRDGSDSVAWHGDRIHRERHESTIAIVSVGGHRPFRLRPRSGGDTTELLVGGGDLLVMGGTCQRTWFHSVPKVREAPPRISITFRVPTDG